MYARVARLLRTLPDSPLTKRAVIGAVASLAAFSALTMIAVIAWLARAEDPWGWHFTVALLSAIAGGTVAFLSWRSPSRAVFAAGIGVMVVSLLRVGPPAQWNWTSFTLLSVTTLLILPLVHAVVVTPPL